MTALFWLALSLFLAASVFGLSWCAVSGLRLWRAFRHGLGGAMEQIEPLLANAEKLAARGERLASDGEEILDAVSRLRRSLARAQVLLGAWRDVSSLVAMLRSLVPAK